MTAHQASNNNTELSGDVYTDVSEYELAKLLHGPHPGIAVNAHYVGDGDIVYRHVCRLGCEGIVSKRIGSPFTDDY